MQCASQCTWQSFRTPPTMRQIDVPPQPLIFLVKYCLLKVNARKTTHFQWTLPFRNRRESSFLEALGRRFLKGRILVFPRITFGRQYFGHKKLVTRTPYFGYLPCGDCVWTQITVIFLWPKKCHPRWGGVLFLCQITFCSYVMSNDFHSIEDWC